MNDSDLRRLMLPDDGLSSERHDLLKERVMTSVKTEQPSPGKQPPLRSRFRLRLVPTLTSMMAVLLMAGAGGAMGLFPWQARDILNDLDCRTGDSIETMVATAQADDGRTFEFWTTRPEANAAVSGESLVEIDADGDYVGGTYGCNSASWDFAPMDEIWASTPAEVSIEGILVSVMGHVPPSAAEVEVTFDDGSTVRTQVQTDGYFLALISGPGVDVSPGNPEPIIPEVVIVTALDDNGNVIAQQDLRDPR